jgi:hypothetical protein
MEGGTRTVKALAQTTHAPAQRCRSPIPLVASHPRRQLFFRLQLFLLSCRSRLL